MSQTKIKDKSLTSADDGKTLTVGEDGNIECKEVSYEYHLI